MFSPHVVKDLENVDRIFFFNIYYLEPHYNTIFGVHSVIRVITEQCYNEELYMENIGSGSQASTVL